MIGVLLFGIAFAVRAAFDEHLTGFPFLTFFPAIVIAALVAGRTQAILIAVASAVTAWYWFVPPAQTWAANDAKNAVSFILFALVSAGLISLVTYFNHVVEDFQSERLEVRRLLAAREAMFAELQHRVANNMQFVSGLLTLQQRRIADPAAIEALEQASARIQAMARIHRRLYDPANADRAFGPLMEELCHELLQATGAKNIVCRVDVPERTNLPMDRVVALSLIVTEALTNAAKHAFPGDRAGTIRIHLGEVDQGQMALTVADDGAGFPSDFDPARSGSLGTRILSALAGQLGGGVTYGPSSAEGGAQVRVWFPTPAPA